MCLLFFQTYLLFLINVTFSEVFRDFSHHTIWSYSNCPVFISSGTRDDENSAVRKGLDHMAQQYSLFITDVFPSALELNAADADPSSDAFKKALAQATKEARLELGVSSSGILGVFS